MFYFSISFIDDLGYMVTIISLDLTDEFLDKNLIIDLLSAFQRFFTISTEIPSFL